MIFSWNKEKTFSKPTWLWSLWSTSEMGNKIKSKRWQTPILHNHFKDDFCNLGENCSEICFKKYENTSFFFFLLLVFRRIKLNKPQEQECFVSVPENILADVDSEDLRVTSYQGGVYPCVWRRERQVPVWPCYVFFSQTTGVFLWTRRLLRVQNITQRSFTPAQRSLCFLVIVRVCFADIFFWSFYHFRCKEWGYMHIITTAKSKTVFWQSMWPKSQMCLNDRETETNFIRWTYVFVKDGSIHLSFFGWCV